MKLSSVTAIAILSGVSLASPAIRGGDASTTSSSLSTSSSSSSTSSTTATAEPITPDSVACEAKTVTVTVTNQGGNAAPADGATITVTAPGSGPSPFGGSPPSNPDTGYTTTIINEGSGGGSSSYTTTIISGGGGSGGSGPDPNSLEPLPDQAPGPVASGGGNDGGLGVNVSVGGGAPTPVAPVNGPLVTDIAKGDDGKQTVRACPTGQQNYECSEVTYGNDGKIITVKIITITITVVNGETVTKTVTNDGSPAITPSPDKPKDNADPDFDVTSVVDITVTSTKNGKTILSTSTHHTVIRGTGTGSASNSQPTHWVKVGETKNEFDPPTVKAKAGDVVRFHFYPRNHSVTSCSSDEPCVENGVFDSGFKSTFIRNSTQFVDYPITNDSAPLHFFSKQKGECKQGMVFAINPASDKGFADFLSKAKAFDEKKLHNGTHNGTITGWNSTLNKHEHEHEHNNRNGTNGTTSTTSSPTPGPSNGPTTFGGKRSMPIQLTGRHAPKAPARKRWFGF